MLITEAGGVLSAGWSADGQTGLGHYNNTATFTSVEGDIKEPSILISFSYHMFYSLKIISDDVFPRIRKPPCDLNPCYVSSLIPQRNTFGNKIRRGDCVR